jgi:hypothetical protein
MCLRGLCIKTNIVHLVLSIYLLLMRLLHVSAPTCKPQSQTLVVINCGLHPLLYILEAVHSCISFHVLTRTKTLPEDGT